jgi:hypothetical protein
MLYLEMEVHRLREENAALRLEIERLRELLRTAGIVDHQETATDGD